MEGSYRVMLLFRAAPLSIFMLGGCTTTPQVLNPDQHKAQIEVDIAALTANQEAVVGPISLYEAMARGLKYNLDYRLELFQEAVAQRQLNLAQWDMLPDLVVKAGYTGRDRPDGASARSLITGERSLESSTSTDRDIVSAQLELTWNVLDFGLSYVRAQQQADRVLIAEERRRKVVHGIFQDVRTAYWRAVVGERLRRELQQLAAKVERALEESRQVQARRLDKPLTTLTYQRELMKIKLEVQQLERDLSFAKAQLAALMNLHPGQDYELVLNTPGAPRAIDLSPEEMEQLALENRPELRELAYESRILSKETKAALLDFLPGIELHAGKNFSSNSFLFASHWLSWGALVGFNLLNAFSAPAKFNELESQQVLLDTRRLALSMAVITQIHVGLAQFERAKDKLETQSEYAETQADILDQIRTAYQANRVSSQSMIREEMNDLVAWVRRDLAQAELETAYAGVFVTLGKDPLPVSVDGHGIKSLAKALEAHWEPQ